MLPENIFLEIFDFYMHQARNQFFIEAWQTLVHVCRGWRNIVFGSPRRLELRLLFTARTPAKGKLDVWPAFPICIREHGFISDADNIIAILEHNDRICEILLYEVPNLLLEKVSAALMQHPFPALTQLQLVSDGETTPLFPPNPFLGGSVPNLQEVLLNGIPFPELPKLILSATHLVDLTLLSIPHHGYISPEAAVACVSALTNLEQLYVEFQLPQPHVDLENQHTHPPSRSVLPSLTIFSFKGLGEYLDDFMARIDTPCLDYFSL